MAVVMPAGWAGGFALLPQGAAPDLGAAGADVGVFGVAVESWRGGVA
ncbi:hypothetical protein [Nonomuraea typhae]|uniref:Uncharacterized protein n=1 Tax=Nonomuraea typhae TaxID=2603600 RepID=A0ABW7Z4K9_9ACTN